MNVDRETPSIFAPASFTATALLIRASCLVWIANLSPASRSTLMPLTVAYIFITAAITGIAVAHWVRYFRAYVDFRIVQLRQERQEFASKTVPATGAVNS